MNPTLAQRFDRLALRLAELEAVLADPRVAADPKRWRELSREQAEADAIVVLWRRYRQREADRDAARAMLSGPEAEDAEMAALARDEVAAAEGELARIDAELQASLVPKDPDDHRNAFVEIRAGTGGDESALFAGDLVRMYLRWCERQRWRTEVLSESPSELGGHKEIVVRVEGEGAYGALRFESGGHRVQRVPATESQGRIHTSACTVAVLPEPDDAEEVQLNPAELRIDTFRSSGAGGQHINKTDSAVRITHLPTGVVRSERAAKEAATRKGLIGSGDRSDRIRTYNFPQGRVTDHRINLTLYKLAQVMDGDLADLVAALQAARAAEQLAALQSSA